MFNRPGPVSAPATAPVSHAPASPVPVRRNIFSGLKDAKATVDANYVGAGDYWLRIDKVKQGETRAPKFQPFLAVEMTVIKVVSSEAGHRPHSVGEEVSWMTMSGDYFFSDIKKFLGASFGFPADQVTDDDIIEATGQMLDASGNLVPKLGPDGQQVQPMRMMVVEMSNRSIVVEDKKNLGQKKEILKRRFVGPVPPATLLSSLKEDEIRRFFPNDYLRQQAA